MSGKRDTWCGTLSKIRVHSSLMCSSYAYFQKEKPSCPLQLSVKLQWLCLTASATLAYLPSYASPQRYYIHKPANLWSGLDLLGTEWYLSDQNGETTALEVRKLIKQGESHQSSWPSRK